MLLAKEEESLIIQSCQGLNDTSSHVENDRGALIGARGMLQTSVALSSRQVGMGIPLKHAACRSVGEPAGTSSRLASHRVLAPCDTHKEVPLRHYTVVEGIHLQVVKKCTGKDKGEEKGGGRSGRSFGKENTYGMSGVENSEVKATQELNRSAWFD